MSQNVGNKIRLNNSDNSFVATIEGITPPNWKGKSIPVPIMGPQGVGGLKKIYSTSWVCDPLKMTVYYNGDQDISTVINLEKTWTITYPVTTGGTTGATDVFSGAIISFSPKTPYDGAMTAEVEIDVNGSMTHTAQV